MPHFVRSFPFWPREPLIKQQVGMKLITLIPSQRCYLVSTPQNLEHVSYDEVVIEVFNSGKSRAEKQRGLT